MTDSLRADQARRVALAAQGFARPAPAGAVGTRQFRRALQDMAVVQLDSVNVVCRSHYLPFFARLGAFDRGALDRWLWRSRENFEYLFHEAAVTSVAHHRLFRWRMRRGRWQLGLRLERERPGYLAAVHDEVSRCGPLSVKELTDPGERTGPWWGYGDGKLALEWLYVTGRLAIHERNPNFVTYYDLPERVVPAEARSAPEPSDEDEAFRSLLVLAAGALGVGTAADLGDYFRLPITRVRPLVREMSLDGTLSAVTVEGWKEPGYVLPGTTVPRRVSARALLSPFDPVVWFRPRAERLFGFHYRIEIYVPAPQRIHGYYVLPFLLGDRLVARVDLKADRKAKVLRVPGAHLEDGADAATVAGELAAALADMAAWLGLDGVAVGGHGELTPALGHAVGSLA